MSVSILDFTGRKYEPIFSIESDAAILSHYLKNRQRNKHLKEKSDEILADRCVNIHGEVIASVIKNWENLLTKEIKENTRFKPSRKKGFSFIDLFAGVGGFRYALQKEGCYCVFSSEWEDSAKETYFKNYGELPFGDITLSEVQDEIPQQFDILCAGFPCQPFSVAGERKGFSDTRGTLFYEIEKITEKYSPKVVFMENVKNFKTHDGGNTMKVVKNTLEEKLGYKLYDVVLNSMTHANIPQNRERIFMVAFKPEALTSDFKWPLSQNLTRTIHDCLVEDPQEAFYYEGHKYYAKLRETIRSKDTVYQWRRVYVRENKSNVCPTLTANMGMGGHNVPIIEDSQGIRRLTPKECFNFQGYPENFYLPENLAKSKLYKQAGNSVTVPLIQSIVREIIKAIK